MSDAVTLAFGHQRGVLLLFLFEFVVQVAIDVGVLLEELPLVLVQATLADAWQEVFAYKLVENVERNDNDEKFDHCPWGCVGRNAFLLDHLAPVGRNVDVFAIDIMQYLATVAVGVTDMHPGVLPDELVEGQFLFNDDTEHIGDIATKVCGLAKAVLAGLRTAYGLVECSTAEATVDADGLA